MSSDLANKVTLVALMNFMQVSWAENHQDNVGTTHDLVIKQTFTRPIVITSHEMHDHIEPGAHDHNINTKNNYARHIHDEETKKCAVNKSFTTRITEWAPKYVEKIKKPNQARPHLSITKKEIDLNKQHVNTQKDASQKKEILVPKPVEFTNKARNKVNVGIDTRQARRVLPLYRTITILVAEEAGR